MLANTFLRWMDRLYGFFIIIGSNLQSVFLLYMRLTWGHRLFLEGTGLLEMAAAVCLFFGFASRLASIPLIALMLTTLSTVHAAQLANFQFIIEPHSLVVLGPYPFLITGLMVLVFGPGRISLDAWIKRWVGKQPKF